MEVSVQTRDLVSPRAARMTERLANTQPLMLSIGVQIVSITQRAFRDSALRPTPWPAKRDGSAATLYKDGPLRQSIRVTSVSAGSVTVGSDRPYAAIHQFGGRTAPHRITAKNAKALRFGSGAAAHFAKWVNHPGSRIPARPFFPFDAQGNPTDEARTSVHALIVEHVRREG